MQSYSYRVLNLARVFMEEENISKSKNDLKPLQSVLGDLKSQGFETDFWFDKTKLRPFQYPSRSYNKSEVEMVDSFRFEGDTDPDDDSILYLIKTCDGLMGTISNGHGLNADDDLDHFLQKKEPRCPVSASFAIDRIA